MPLSSRLAATSRLVATSALLLLVLLVVGSTPAAAHVELVETMPAIDSAVADPPTEVVLMFSGPLAEDGVPAIRVIDPNGDDLTAAPATLETDAVRVPMNLAVTPGVHTVDWVIVASDGDEQRGTFEFTFAPPEEIATPPAASPSPDVDPTADEAGPAAEPGDPTDEGPQADASLEPAPAPTTADPDATSTESTTPVLATDDGGGVSPILIGGAVLLAVAAVAIVVLKRPDPRQM